MGGGPCDFGGKAVGGVPAIQAGDGEKRLLDTMPQKAAMRQWNWRNETILDNWGCAYDHPYEEIKTGRETGTVIMHRGGTACATP